MTGRTGRQALMDLLREGDQSFEGLRLQLGLRPRDLEDELRHVERTARHVGARLVVTPARCQACRYVFRGGRHLRTPGRCPRCRSEGIVDVLLRLEES